MRPADDRGSGSLLGIAVIGSIIAVVSTSLPLYIGLAVREGLASSTDAATLGAADVATGLAPGSPCTAAAHVAAANGEVQTACRVDGLVVTTRESRSFLGLELTATATAGPPRLGTN